MRFTLLFQYGEVEPREIDVNNIAELEKLKERLEKSPGDCTWNPPYELIINFEDRTIKIYDGYLE